MKLALAVLVVVAVVLVLAVESVFHGGRPGRTQLAAEPPMPDYFAGDAAAPEYVGRHRLSGDDTHQIDTRFWVEEVELVRSYTTGGDQ